MRALCEPWELTLIKAGVLVVRMGAHQAHLEEEVELLVSERLHREATHDRGRGVEARPARSLVVCAAAVWQAFEHNGLIVGGTVSGCV